MIKMIDIKILDGNDYIYKHKFLQYLQNVAKKLQEKYKYQLNTTIVFIETNNKNKIDIQIRLYDEFIKIGHDGQNAKVIKFDYNNSSKYIDTIDIENVVIPLATPIEIELGIVINLMKLIYSIDGCRHRRIDIYNDCSDIISPWIPIISSANYVYGDNRAGIHFLDKLRRTLKLYTEPTLANQIAHLTKSYFLCYDADSKIRMVETTSSSAIDMILDNYEDRFDMQFDALDSFEITVQQKDDIAKLRMDIELDKEFSINISDASFTANYTDDFNNPIQIPDPSYAIAHLLINFFIYYMRTIEKDGNLNFDEKLSNFKDVIMQTLPVAI